MKGILTQELAQEFDFITIGIEDVIFSYLPQKEANTVQNTVEINELLRRNPGIINLRWVLQMVGAKIATAHTNVQIYCGYCSRIVIYSKICSVYSSGS
ncbi:unnamed protein product [Meloidogyne enterolobii]|uniref:Uncharacterized protein n=1 Tax=Meloidogyne enterolobii TaxID=390850 RepID=A0ACB1AWP0_MELEN